MQFMLTEADHRQAGLVGKHGPFGGLRKTLERRVTAFRGETVVLNTPRNHPPYYKDVVERALSTGEYWPVILGTHNSHVAAFPALEEAEYIKGIANNVMPGQRIQGSRLVVAANIRSGQNEEVHEYFKLSKKLFDKVNAQAMFVVRNKDVANGEVRNREKQHEGFMSLVKDGRIPVILPEGSVESGRQKPNGAPGEVKGMIPLSRSSVRLIVRYIRHQGKEPLIVFVGTTGANHIYDPISEKITTEAKKRAMGIRRSPLMSSIVDYPTRADELEKHLQIDGRVPDGAWEKYAGERLAQLIPPNERGVYASPILLAKVPVLRRSTSQLF